MADETRNATTLQAAGSWTSEANFTGAGDSSCMSASSDGIVSGEFSFNFSTLSGTINGIELTIHHAVGDDNDFVEVELYDSTSAWRLKTVAWSVNGNCAAAVDRTVGGSTDTWGGTWSDTHIKSTSFRIRVTAQTAGKAGASWLADSCSCKVYYTETGAEEIMLID